MIKLGTVIPYLKNIQKTNGQKRYQQSATFVVIRNFLMSDLKNGIFKMTFSKFKCSQNYFETSLLTKVFLQLCRVIYYNYVGCHVKFLILTGSLPS